MTTATDLKHDPQFSTYRLCLYLLREYASEADLSTEQLPHIKLQSFAEWCDVYLGSRTQVQLRQLAEECNITNSQLKEIWRLLQNPYQSVPVLSTMWSSLTLRSQPPLEVPVVLIHLSASIGFANQTVVQIAVPTLPEQMPQGSVLDAGTILSLWQGQFAEIMRMIGEHTLDELRTKHSQPAPILIGLPMSDSESPTSSEKGNT